MGVGIISIVNKGIFPSGVTAEELVAPQICFEIQGVDLANVYIEIHGLFLFYKI